MGCGLHVVCHTAFEIMVNGARSVKAYMFYYVNLSFLSLPQVGCIVTALHPVDAK